MGKRKVRSMSASEVPESYPLSRSAQRERFGTRSIKGSGENDFSPMDKTPSALASRAGNIDGVTPQSDWDKMFKPRLAPSLEPTIAPDVNAFVETWNSRPVAGGGTITTTPGIGGEIRTLDSPYGSGSATVPNAYLDRITGGATGMRRRNRDRNSPISKQLQQNNLGYSPIA